MVSFKIYLVIVTPNLPPGQLWRQRRGRREGWRGQEPECTGWAGEKIDQVLIQRRCNVESESGKENKEKQMKIRRKVKVFQFWGKMQKGKESDSREKVRNVKRWTWKQKFEIEWKIATFPDPLRRQPRNWISNLKKKPVIRYPNLKMLGYFKPEAHFYWFR